MTETQTPEPEEVEAPTEPEVEPSVDTEGMGDAAPTETEGGEA